MSSSTFKSPEQSRVMLSILMLPSNANFSGKIHGGYVLSLIDQIAFACASKHSGHYCVTASVDVVDFKAPIEVGEMLTLRASVNYVGRSSMVVGIRVDSENIQTGESKHCNSSFLTMVAKDENGNTVKVPGLKITNETHVRRFARAIKRKQIKIKSAKEIAEANFSDTKYLEEFKNYNVQVKL
ncbi:acyl CoA thioester hydrolase family protein [Nonlabens tegetincola]|uniref:Acyl CoA thioester hydrolase family protein n=1 Tax=Nonlabens tegetincola TaxID=323273 RepID=A0A090Q3E3_9FLAO|nr:acyl-CoA thioesterase [Nonlabens tegetincola]GAK96732.1 acyl CoA thioester hydrolase family protein [Nonlabens tegetincola]